MTGELHLKRSREVAFVFLAALEARGAVFWLDDDECMCCDLANGASM